MPQTRYNKCKDMLRAYLKKYGDRISFKQLRKEIHKNIGSSEYRVIRPAMKMMMETYLIKDEGNYYMINKKEVLQ